MKKAFLVTGIVCCTFVVSAQNKSNLAGEYTVKENCWLSSFFTTTSEYTRNYKIDVNPGDNELLSITIGWADYTGKSLGNNYFTIIDTDMHSFGVVARDSFYLYYNKIYPGEESVYGECICVGSRKTEADSSQANVKKTSAPSQNRISKSYYSDPELLAQEKPNFAGEYKITTFSKELIGNKKAFECESSITISYDADDKPILSGIVGQLEMKTLDANYFYVNQLSPDSTDISVYGFGLMKNDSIYLYYYTNNKTDTTKSICVGTRKIATGFNLMPATNAVLYQNTPNPFSAETKIKYCLPENVENAAINVYSLNGNLLLTKPITQLGNGSIIINGNELEAGMYIYTLAVDGQEVDSKRMILNSK